MYPHRGLFKGVPCFITQSQIRNGEFILHLYGRCIWVIAGDALKVIAMRPLMEVLQQESGFTDCNVNRILLQIIESCIKLFNLLFYISEHRWF